MAPKVGRSGEREAYYQHGAEQRTQFREIVPAEESAFQDADHEPEQAKVGYPYPEGPAQGAGELVPLDGLYAAGESVAKHKPWP